MDYIDKIDLQIKEVKEVEALEKHTIIYSEPISVNKYIGHTKEFLTIGEKYNDGFNQLIVLVKENVPDVPDVP